MPGHRYINLDVGYNTAGTGPGRKGGETQHAPYEEARRLADAVRQVLEGREEARALLRRYILVGVDPSPAHGGKAK